MPELKVERKWRLKNLYNFGNKQKNFSFFSSMYFQQPKFLNVLKYIMSIVINSKYCSLKRSKIASGAFCGR